MQGVILDPVSGRPFNSVLTVEAVNMNDPDRYEKIASIKKLLSKSKEEPDLVAYTRNKHYIGARQAAASAATLRTAAFNLWNPHASSRIQLFEIWVSPTTAGSINLGVSRTTARGTATTTVAAAIANSIANDSAAPSGFVIDTAWSVQPTISTADLIRWVTPAAVGNGVILPIPDPIDINPSTGMALITTIAAAFPISDVTFVIGD